MRRYLLAAVAAAAIATPALARDGSPYVGIEGGAMIVEDLDFDVDSDGTDFNDGLRLDFDYGLDVDAIAGYDFGAFRLEGEIGYKRLNVDEARISSALAADLGVPSGDFDVSDNGRVLSLMANALLDFGDDNGWSGYVGGGIGRARVRLAGERDSAFAWQGIAGVRRAISDNIDVGLKYRYFRTSDFDFDDDDGFGSRAKLRTHSLLASLIFNFAPPPPPPVFVEPAPPPPPPPATQTCFDGSVILATDICPQPPVEAPPPPPEPIPERG